MNIPFAYTGIEGSDDEALDTGQDEEVSRWEQEQIRKGISIPQVSYTKSLNCCRVFSCSSNELLVDSSSAISRSSKKHYVFSLFLMTRSKATRQRTTQSTTRTATRASPMDLPTACLSPTALWPRRLASQLAEQTMALFTMGPLLVI